MRTIRIILILLVLIGFPAMSWIYLKSGLKWRVNAQEETTLKEGLADFMLKASDKDVPSSSLIGKYYVMASPTDSVSLENLKLIHAQFDARKDFKTLYLMADSLAPMTRIDSTWVATQCVAGCASLSKTLFAPDFSAAIVDDSLHVRGRYHLGSIEEMRKLVEHLAVVLPIERRERIELKRGDGNN